MATTFVVGERFECCLDFLGSGVVVRVEVQMEAQIALSMLLAGAVLFAGA